MDGVDDHRKLQLRVYNRELKLMIESQRLDVNEEWKLIPRESLHIMHGLIDNPPIVKRNPIRRQLPEMNMKSFAGSMSVAESSSTNQSLTNVTSCVNGNVSVQFLVITSARCNIIHEHTIGKVGGAIYGPSKELFGVTQFSIYIYWG